MPTFDAETDGVKTECSVPSEIKALAAQAEYVLYFYNGRFLSEPSQSVQDLALTVKPLVSAQSRVEHQGAFVKIAKTNGPTVKIAVIHLYGNALGADMQQPFSTGTHNTYFFGPNSQAEIFEAHFAANSIEFVARNISDFVLDAQAKASVVQVIWPGIDASIENQVQGQLKSNANLQFLNCSLRGKSIHNDISIRLCESGASTSLMNLCRADNSSQTTHVTFINHEVGETQSCQTSRNVLTDSARVIFNGKLLIAQNAQKSEAHQMVKSLLLSDQAQVEAQPQLEVFADDVKASHGATVGQIDVEELFYLQSRGLSQERAAQMLALGFQQALIEKIKAPFLREAIRETLGRCVDGCVP